MADHAIIEADFANVRFVQGRKVMQLICEVPMERGEEVIGILGLPKTGESKWVAIARLAPK